MRRDFGVSVYFYRTMFQQKIPKLDCDDVGRNKCFYSNFKYIKAKAAGIKARRRLDDNENEDDENDHGRTDT